MKNLSNGQSALLIEGARRIGKSTIVEDFAKKEYDDYIETGSLISIKKNVKDILIPSEEYRFI